MNNKKSLECPKSCIWFLPIFFYVCPAIAETSAKALFEDDGTTVATSNFSAPASPASSNPSPRATTSYAGVQYWIELQNSEGANQRVSTNHVFFSGDRIRLHVKSKSSGFLTIIDQDDSGQIFHLYPAKDQIPEQVNANSFVTIPTKGYIYFDNNPGTEKIIIAVSKFPLSSATPPSAPSANDMRPASYTNGSSTLPIYTACSDSITGAKGMFSSESGVNCLRENYSIGSKGMFTEEDSTSGTPANYALVPESSINDGHIMFVDVKLSHR